MKKFSASLTLLFSVSMFAQVSTTPNLGLEVPAKGSNNWDIPLNYNFNRLDQLLSGRLIINGTSWAPRPIYGTGSPSVSCSITNDGQNYYDINELPFKSYVCHTTWNLVGGSGGGGAAPSCVGLAVANNGTWESCTPTTNYYLASNPSGFISSVTSDMIISALGSPSLVDCSTCSVTGTWPNQSISCDFGSGSGTGLLGALEGVCESFTEFPDGTQFDGYDVFCADSSHRWLQNVNNTGWKPVQVQPDWDQADDAQPDYIKNKPGSTSGTGLLALQEGTCSSAVATDIHGMTTFSGYDVLCANSSDHTWWHNLNNGGWEALSTYTLPIATTTVRGGFKPDGTTINVNPTTGVASVTSPATAPFRPNFVISNGAPASLTGPLLMADGTGSLTACRAIVKASDATTDLSFQIMRKTTGGSPADIFSTDPVITHGAAQWSEVTFTALTSSPLSVADGDAFGLTILTGTASWSVTIQCQ